VGDSCNQNFNPSQRRSGGNAGQARKLEQELSKLRKPLCLASPLWRQGCSRLGDRNSVFQAEPILVAESSPAANWRKREKRMIPMRILSRVRLSNGRINYKVNSTSDARKRYTVQFSGKTPKGCSCRGWIFNRVNCRHIRFVKGKVA